MPTMHIPQDTYERLLRYADEWEGEMSLITALDLQVGEHDGSVCSASEPDPFDNDGYDLYERDAIEYEPESVWTRLRHPEV